MTKLRLSLHRTANLAFVHPSLISDNLITQREPKLLPRDVPEAENSD
jgi:hypothetical protein